MNKLEQRLDFRHEPVVVKLNHKWSLKVLQVIESNCQKKKKKNKESRSLDDSTSKLILEGGCTYVFTSLNNFSEDIGHKKEV